MTQYLTKALGLCTALLVLTTSCKKDEIQATLTPSGTMTLTSTPSSVVLLQANATQTAATFNWTPLTLTAANMENPSTTTISYIFQVDKKGNNFAKPATFSPGSTSPTKITVGDLNDLLTGTLGLTPGTAADLEVRIAATYASNIAATYSPVVALNATPYLYNCSAPAGSATWSIIGPAGVDWSTDIPLKYNCTTNTFDITRAFKADEFKFRANNDWTLNYGSATSGGGALVANGSNIKVTTAGTYTVKLDLNTMTYTIK